MPTLFTKIVNREIPANIVAEDDEFLAFLDIRPIVIGHTLVIPKQEIVYVLDIEDELLGRMMAFSKKVAQALKDVTNAKRIGFAASGFEIPHAHIHLCPINVTSEMACTNPPLPVTNEELCSLAMKIRECYVHLNRNPTV